MHTLLAEWCRYKPQPVWEAATRSVLEIWAHDAWARRELALALALSAAVERREAVLGNDLLEVPTANLLDHVLPKAPLRQWVLTLPFELRRRVAYDGKVFSEVSRLFTDSVLGWYRRRLADQGAPNGRGGAVVVMQRASSDLRCNPHLHGIFLDGLFVMGPEGVPVFRALPRLSTTDAAEVLQIVRARVVRRLVRLGVLAADDDATVVDDVDAETVLSQLAAAAIAGLPPAGPEVRRGRLPITLRGDAAESPEGDKPGVTVTAPRCVEEQGFTLHANTCAGAEDERGREALLQYVLRPPIANEHVQEGPEGLVRILLKRPFSDGTTAIDMDPLSLLCRLASMVPSPRIHTVRYSGVLSSASTWRALVIPPPPPAADGSTPVAPGADGKPDRFGSVDIGDESADFPDLPEIANSNLATSEPRQAPLTRAAEYWSPLLAVRKSFAPRSAPVRSGVVSNSSSSSRRRRRCRGE